MRSLYLRRLVTSTSGNISARVPGSKFVLITPTGLTKSNLKEKDLVKIDLDGKIVEGSNMPSKEWHLHVEILKARKDVNAVVHAHNPFTMGVTMVSKKFKPVTAEASIILKGVVILPFKKPGSEELGKIVGKNIAGRNALILRRHGVIGIGSDVNEARAVVEAIEDDAIVQTVMRIFHGSVSRH
ncbi:MAG: class II aldolase/adducin family protein [archaeon]|nr:class II aldolase/adducin family protein [archaeon]MCP8313659.1 class II aldolase/adducin family protein [archaeon]